MRKSLAIPLVIVVCGVLWLAMRPGQQAREIAREPRSGRPAVAFDLEQTRTEVETFCGDCHKTPHADRFPRDDWEFEVKRGFSFYLKSGRSDLVPPAMEPVVEYFRQAAPEKLPLPDVEPASSAPSVRFRKESAELEDQPRVPATAYLKFGQWQSDTPPFLLVCDMFQGDVGSVSLVGGTYRFQNWGTLPQPCHIEATDLDGDGVTDYVVAALGSYAPGDHDKGAVIWLHPAPGRSGRMEASVLQAGLGRVADVRPGDFDGDGDLDLIVGEFGYIETGRILLLRNTSSNAGPPQFELEVVDPRHGTIHVPTADLDGDGHLDFVALISQEHEVIEAFLNRGDGTFERHTIFAADDPSYGSSGIQLVDFDRDGDLDVLYTNGDTLDSHFLKPYHSVQWLENTGSYPYRHHHLAAMPGVARALAADLDGDGDLDVAAVAFFPANLRTQPGFERLDSIMWLEQVAPGQFARHRLESETIEHMSLEIADADGDGDFDLFVGNYAGDPRSPLNKSNQMLTIWRNLKHD